MAAQKGNKNAAYGREFRDALRKAFAREEGSVAKGLAKVAKSLVDAANAGEQWAIKEVADRFDGKPGQSVSVTGADGGPLQSHHRVTYEIVDPAETEGSEGV